MDPAIARTSSSPRVRLDHLAGIGDSVIVRDAAGRSRSPALVAATGHRQLAMRGAFTVIQRFAVDAEDGASFARTMRDDNPIHTSGEVVPGAMTAARFLLVPEILIAGARIERAKMRFRAVALYGRPTVCVFRFERSGPGTIKTAVSVRQEAVEVADAQLHLSVRAPAGEPGSPELPPAAREETAETARVREFLRTLRVDPACYFMGAGPIYPRAYLAALPPGEMVRKFSGEGGILNSLDLEFAGEAVLGAAAAPTVELEDSARARKTFRKILARIVEGVRTFCSGFAMVLPRESAGILK